MVALAQSAVPGTVLEAVDSGCDVGDEELVSTVVGPVNSDPTVAAVLAPVDNS